MRIVLHDAKMDAAAIKLSGLQFELGGAAGRMNASLSAGAPPAIKGQVDGAVAEARALTLGVAGRCSARSNELRRRAILARIAGGDIRPIDLRTLAALTPDRPVVNARVGNREVDDGKNPFERFADGVGDAVRDVGKHALGATHLGLDGLGMVPLFGEAADLLNGGIYLIEGDKTNAALSAGAAIPIAGWGATAGKWGKRAYDFYGRSRKAPPTPPRPPKPPEPPKPSAGRRSWRDSEHEVGRRLGPGYSEQTSFRGGKPAPHGKGTSRPDFYHPGKNESVEVKNYDFSRPDGPSSLARIVADQYEKRLTDLPAGATQRIEIDIGGQAVSRQQREAVEDMIEQRLKARGVHTMPNVNFFQ